MESNSVRDVHGAQAALNAIAGARASAAKRLTSPWWYHPILGLLAAGFVVSYTLGGVWVMLIVSVLYFGGLGILMGTYKKKTGIWINGLKTGRASWWTLSLAVIMIASMGGAYYLHAAHGIDWPAWVAGILIVVAVNIFGRRFDMTLRSQLRQKP